MNCFYISLSFSFHFIYKKKKTVLQDFCCFCVALFLPLLQELQPQEELKVESVEAPLEELQDAPQLGIVYGPWKKEEEILPLLSEESNGKEPREEPQKAITQATNSPLPSPVYTLLITQFTPAAQFTPQAPTTKATPSLLVLQNIRKLVATIQASTTTSKTQAVTYITWHSDWFGYRFGFGAPKSLHF